MSKEKALVKGKLKGLHQAGTLKQWRVVDDQPGYSFATGRIYGDSRWDDGTIIYTSEVKEVDQDKEYLLTRNSVYFLEDEFKE